MKNPFSADPFSQVEEVQVIACPICKSTDFEAHQNEWGSWRDCRSCGNVWHGSSVIGVARPDFSDIPPPNGAPAADADELPGPRYTGASFRDPSKNWSPDE